MYMYSITHHGFVSIGGYIYCLCYVVLRKRRSRRILDDKHFLCAPLGSCLIQLAQSIKNLESVLVTHWFLYKQQITERQLLYLLFVFYQHPRLSADGLTSRCG